MRILKFAPVLLLILLLFLGVGRTRQQFTPEKWLEAGPNRRGKLVESLLEQYNRLEGMSRREVEALLGPDQEGEQSVENGMTGEQIPVLVYPAGGRSLSGLPEYLFVYLKGDVVTGARLESD